MKYEAMNYFVFAVMALMIGSTIHGIYVLVRRYWLKGWRVEYVNNEGIVIFHIIEDYREANRLAESISLSGRNSSYVYIRRALPEEKEWT